MEIIPRSAPTASTAGANPGHRTQHNTKQHQNLDPTLGSGHALGLVPRVDWTTWWPWRGACTRSHPELGREIPQRPWYCVLRHGRVGRRQVFQSTQPSPSPTRGGAARKLVRLITCRPQVQILPPQPNSPNCQNRLTAIQPANLRKVGIEMLLQVLPAIHVILL